MGNSDSKPKGPQGSDPRLSKVFEEMRKRQTRRKNILKAERTNILANGLAYFKSPDQEFHPLEVQMVTSGVEENATDFGGPTREFFSVFFREILKKGVDMFEGQDTGRSLLPVFNDRAVEDGWYAALGKAIVLSLLCNGPGFPYLAPCVISYIRGRDYVEELSIGMVYNTLLRHFIDKLNGAKSEEELQAVINDDTERYIDHCGWPRNQMITLRNRLQLTQVLLKWELINKRLPALEQLKKGLNTLSFLDKTAKLQHVDGFFLHQNSEQVTAEYLRKTLTREIEKLPTVNEDENTVRRVILSCLTDLTDEEATSLFHFITGLSTLPVEDVPIQVEYNRSNKTARLPEAVTCIQKLRLPLGNAGSKMETFSSFQKALTIGKYGFSSSREK